MRKLKEKVQCNGERIDWTQDDIQSIYRQLSSQKKKQKETNFALNFLVVAFWAIIIFLIYNRQAF